MFLLLEAAQVHMYSYVYSNSKKPASMFHLVWKYICSILHDILLQQFIFYLFCGNYYNILKNTCDLAQKYSQEAVSNHELIILHNFEH